MIAVTWGSRIPGGMKPSEVLSEIEALKKQPRHKVLGVVLGLAAVAVGWTFVSAYVANCAKTEPEPRDASVVPAPVPHMTPDQHVAQLMTELSAARLAVTRDAKDRCAYLDGLALDGNKPELPDQAQERKTNTANLRSRFASIASQLTALGVTDFDHDDGSKPAHCGAELMRVEQPR